MDFEFEDVPLEIASLFIIVAITLQCLLLFPSLAPPNFQAISPFLLLASLALLATGVGRLIVAAREKLFSNRDYFRRYIYGRVDELEEKIGKLESSLGKFQRLMLNHVDTLKSQISNETSRSKRSTLEEPVPTKRQLIVLRNQLGIQKGSLQHRSGSIYHIVYDSEAKKHQWTRLGSWSDLKQKLQQENSSD